MSTSLISSLGAVDLLNEDFSLNDGGFTVTNENGHVDPWAYDAVAKAWSTDGSENGLANQHTRLTSPELNVTATGGYMLEFSHRYDIEGGDWDGGGVFVSVNGGDFRYVESSEFTMNGYNTGSLIGAHALGGLTAFGGISPDHSLGTYITSIAGPFPLEAGDVVQFQFLMANDQSAVGTLTPNWEIEFVSVSSLPDLDGDGMPDSYEDDNLLDKNNDDTGEDPDTDNSSNLEEFLRRTDPQDDDTDDDGIIDGSESNTGTFVGANDTGTDPLNPDTDGDGLLDGDETNTGIFVDASNTGTDPLKVETDGDGVPDQVEVALSSDPNDGESFPDRWAVRNALSSSALNSIADTRALFSGKNVTSETITEHDFVVFRENATGPFGGAEAFPAIGTQDTDTNDYGILAYGRIFIEDPGFYTFGFNSDDGGGLYIDGEPVVLADLNRGSTTSLGAVKLAYGNHQVEFIYWERGGGAQAQVFVASEAGDKTGVPFVVGDYELLGTSYTPDADVDADGLIDGWEMKYFGNLDQLATDDPDSDGSDNLEEQTRGTTPDVDDTDGDGVLDGSEDGGGVFVSATQTGTDPCIADTDGDGLLDGVEDNGGELVSTSQTGSDPNKFDTDGDGQNDGFEVTNNTDPSDPESKSAVPSIEIIAGLLGGDLTDPEDDGVEGATVPANGADPQTAGTNFNWIGISASSEEYFSGFGGSEGSFDLFDNQIGGGAAKLCCNGAPQSVTVQFEEAVSLTHFTLTSSNDTPARDPLDFQIQGSNDGTNFETIFEQADDVALWNARNQTVQITLASPSLSYTYIRYSVTRTGGANHALSEIEYFGSVGPSVPPEITDVVYDADTNRVTLTWNSKENKTYSVFSSSDLVDFSNELDDSVPADVGESTTKTFILFGGALDRLFFRVVENQ